jgi:HSP20 family protein
MSALTRIDRMEDWFPDMMRRFMRPVGYTPQLAADLPGEIRVDVSESEKAYEVRAEVPGAKKDDIRITIDGNFVSILAEVKRESESDKGKKGERVLVRELSYGSSQRSFSLPQDVDSKAAEAKFEDGVLKLSLPKRQESSSRTLKIQ